MNRIIKLPKPKKDLDFPLMKALEKRRSIRKWKDKPISEQEISNLLWAACGITKEKYGNVKCKRTAPSSCNAQEIRVYVLLEKGAFLYNEENHELVEIIADDIREHTGTQKMMKSAPVAGEARGGGSSWQSLARGTGNIEADYLNGEIALLGRLHGVPTPANITLQRLANQLAANKGEPKSIPLAEVRRQIDQVS